MVPESDIQVMMHGQFIQVFEDWLRSRNAMLLRFHGGHEDDLPTYMITPTQNVVFTPTGERF